MIVRHHSTSTNPAKLFGLFPKKGTIAVGSDADLVIWDPDATGTVRNENLHHAVDFSVYEGQPYRGRVVDVFRRGERIVRNGEFIGTPGSGQFLKRNKYVQRRG